ncbi:MAG: PLP-dependent aminotransferase family protein [Undibacterium sp.]|nr:PLP-dependent aminotransferase family protein [Undibacterium sp.]
MQIPALGTRQILQSLHQQLRDAIVDGRLTAGQRMPSTRTLAHLLGISRSTVSSCYELLINEAYLRSQSGSGTYVASVLGLRTRQTPLDTSTLLQKINPIWRTATLPVQLKTPVKFDFSIGNPDPRFFPYEVWRRLVARAMLVSEKTKSSYSDPQGDPQLRIAIAHHVSLTRAVACSADDIIVTAGAQQAMDLLARVLVTPGRTKCVLENPSYPALRHAFAGAGAKLYPIAVDQDGLIVEQLPQRMQILCVSPTHQSPTGATLSATRRAQLLDYASSNDAIIIEDDYDGEFRLSGRPLDALQTLDREQRVFYIGTFSKSMFSSLRIGFVVAPIWARAALINAKIACNWQVPLIAQAALAEFISQGQLAKHVRKMRDIYIIRNKAIVHALDQHFGSQLEILPSLAGMHICTLLDKKYKAEHWLAAALKAGIRIESLDRYHYPSSSLPTSDISHGPNGLLFGYGLMDVDRIHAGMKLLKRVTDA